MVVRFCLELWYFYGEGADFSASFFYYLLMRSFATSPAIISPATDGTNATLPGMSLRSVHLCSAPGGQMQLFLQLIAISSIGLVGISSEYTTLSFLTPLFFSSLLMTFASGHTFVLYISATLNWLPSSLFPAPMLC